MENFNGWETDFAGGRLHYRNGLLHRENGPAVILRDGYRAWYLDGKPLTESEWKAAMAEKAAKAKAKKAVPAKGRTGWFTSRKGTKCSFLNGKLHNEFGPAVIHADGDREWFLDDKQYTPTEWTAEMARRKGITVISISVKISG